MTRYDVTVGDKTFSDRPKRRAIYHVIRALCDSGIDPDAIRTTIPWKKSTATQMIEEGGQPRTFRFFTDNSELIHANGKTYAATKMCCRHCRQENHALSVDNQPRKAP